MIRACHVVYAVYPADPRVRKEVETLVRAGISVHVVSARAAGESRRDTNSGVFIHRLPLEVRRGGRVRYVYQYTMFSLLTFVSLLVLQLQHRFHIVHVHSLPDFLVFFALPAKILGAKLVLDLHESMPELAAARFPVESGRRLLSLAIAAQRLSCMVSDRVITVNSRIAGLISLRAGGARQPDVVENSPDWASSTQEFEESEPPLLAIACGLNPERDLELVIRTAGAVLATHPINVRIVGSGDPHYVAKLRALAKQIGSGTEIRIDDAIPGSEVLGFLSRSTFGLVTYQRNKLTELATPNKVYEYAFLGKAMVVADLPSLRNLLGDSVLYYEPGNFEELLNAILRILGDSTLRRRLGNRARDVAEGHSWEKMSGRLISVYESVVGVSFTAPSGG